MISDTQMRYGSRVRRQGRSRRWRSNQESRSRARALELGSFVIAPVYTPYRPIWRTPSGGVRKGVEALALLGGCLGSTPVDLGGLAGFVGRRDSGPARGKDLVDEPGASLST